MPDARSGGGQKDGGRRAAEQSSAARVLPPTAREWTVLTHPLLVGQLEKVVAAAEGELARDPDGPPGANRKLLRNLLALMFDEIPERPGGRKYQQGGTLGPELKHWFRGKTGNGRYRLFYRFDSKVRVIVYAWVNDEETLRTYGKRTDAYAVFRRMVLHDEDPPNSWAALRAAAEAEGAVATARGLADRHARDRREGREAPRRP